MQRHTVGTVRAWVAVGRARVNGNIALVARVSAAAQARQIAVARLIFAHRACRARVNVAAALFLLAIFARVSRRALAAIALRQIRTDAAIVAWAGGALVDVDLAATARKSGRTEAEFLFCSGENVRLD